VSLDQPARVGGDGLAQRLLATPADHHAGATAGELERRLTAETGAAAGDDRHLAVQQ
jgi:hypothetical protein